jgi:hypothetical protein
MTNLITGLIGVAGFCAFVGILLWWTRAVPLIVICALVFVLVLVDFVQSMLPGKSGKS